MKIIEEKIKLILEDQSGETIMEAIVAFALLSIMLVVFAQGLAYATNTSAYASDNRKKADEAMINLQDQLATKPINSVEGKARPVPAVPISRCVYQADGVNYIVYEVDN